MSYAYTPGLKIKETDTIWRDRILPVPGKISVKIDELVNYDDIVAETHIPGDVTLIKAAFETGLEPVEIPRIMLKKVGESFVEGEIIGLNKSFFGLFKTEIKAPIDGVIEHISEVTGTITLRHLPIPIHKTAYISGKIIKIFPDFGVRIQTIGSIVQGIFGLGGENHGLVKIIASPDEVITVDLIKNEYAGKVVVGGSLITPEALQTASSVGVKGIICGGVMKDDITQFLGYDIGVAITGDEKIPLTFIITEGFGKMSMAGHTYKLLESVEGKMACINGATQIRAGVMRPEIIVPITEATEIQDESDELAHGMTPGTLVRKIRAPYFGAIGMIEELPVELQNIQTESKVRVALLKLLEEDETILAPRANVEIMETEK